MNLYNYERKTMFWNAFKFHLLEMNNRSIFFYETLKKIIFNRFNYSVFDGFNLVKYVIRGRFNVANGLPTVFTNPWKIIIFWRFFKTSVIPGDFQTPVIFGSFQTLVIPIGFQIPVFPSSFQIPVFKPPLLYNT